MTNAETQVGDPAVEAEVGVEDSSSIEDAEISASVRYEISSYGADYPVDGLVKRISRGDIYVPEFQRGFVWTHAQSSRFIESLLLGLPVPGIFLFKEPETQRLVVVDGQQRLRTLQTYYHGIIRGREFALRGVSEELNDLTYKSLPEDDRRRLDDAIVHATIFQQEDPQDDLSSIYLVFERLNTGGTPLVEQEIRSCVYPGPFNDLLEELAAHPKWREIYGSPSTRGKDQEIILRFLAFFYNSENYERPLKGFLDNFMGSKRKATLKNISEMRQLFESTVTVAADHLTRSVFRSERNLNAAVVDAFFVGLARRLGKGDVINRDRLKPAAERVLENEKF